MDNLSLSHCKWNCTYHIVFILKYRRKIMYEEVKKDIVEIIKKPCEIKQVKLIDGRVCKEHIPMYVSIPPKLSVSVFMGYLKGKSALIIFDRHLERGSKRDRNDMLYCILIIINKIRRNYGSCIAHPLLTPMVFHI